MEYHGGAYDGELTGDGDDDDGNTIVYQGIKKTMGPMRYSNGTSVQVQHAAAHRCPHTTATGRNITPSQRTKVTPTSEVHNDYDREAKENVFSRHLLQATDELMKKTYEECG